MVSLVFFNIALLAARRAGTRRGRRRIAHADGLRLDRHAGEEDLLHPVHDDLVFGTEPLGDDAQAFGLAPELDVAAQRAVLRAEHVDVLAVLVGEDGLVVDQQRGKLRAALQLHASEQPGREPVIGIGDDGTRTDRAGAGVDLVVDEIEHAGVREAILVGEADAHRKAYRGTRTAARQLEVAQVGLQMRQHDCLEVGQGQVMSVNVTADRLVDPPGATPDIFTTLTTIGNALKAGDVTTASNVGIAELDVHIANVNSLRGEVGTKINRLELTSSRFDIDDIARQSQLSSIEDADIAKTVMDLQMRQNVLQGSLAVGARVMQRSLVDFIS